MGFTDHYPPGCYYAWIVKVRHRLPMGSRPTRMHWGRWKTTGTFFSEKDALAEATDRLLIMKEAGEVAIFFQGKKIKTVGRAW